jgi:hypothetical protein
MKKDVIDKLAALTTAAFGLVAALAWNDAIKALFKGPCGGEGAGALCSLSSGGPWVYALIVTVFAIFATLWIGKVAQKASETSFKEHVRWKKRQEDKMEEQEKQSKKKSNKKAVK